MTDESKVFLRATFMLRFGVRACVVATSSAKAVKRMFLFVRGAFVAFLFVRGAFVARLLDLLRDVWAACATPTGGDKRCASRTFKVGSKTQCCATQLALACVLSL